MKRISGIFALGAAITLAGCAHSAATPDTSIAPATIAAELARDSAGLARKGFYQRLSTINGAYFITPDDIAETRATSVADLFWDVPVLNQSFGRYGPVVRGANGCLITYVDGLRLRRFPGDLSTYVPLNDVVGAEVYPPGQLPPVPFASSRPNFNCTTLAIWSRSSVG